MWFLVAVLLAIAGAAPLSADTLPRYAQRHVYGVKPGPRALIIALPYVNWQDLRGADVPHLRWLTDHGATGLMPIAQPNLPDPNRTWVSLGAGRAAAGGPETLGVTRSREGRLTADVAQVWAANRKADTRARPGTLGAALQEHGLSAFVVAVAQDWRGQWAWPEAAVLMGGDGGLAGGIAVPYTLTRGADGPAAEVDAAAAALQLALARYDVVLLSLGNMTTEARGRRVVPDWVRGMRLRAADELVGRALRWLEGRDALVALLVPSAPFYQNPFTTKSLGPVALYETMRPRRGLLYSETTRWPGLITAADFAPTLLQWWEVAVNSPNGEMDGRVLTVKPGSPAALGQLDRMLSDHFRWGFTAVGLTVLYIGGLLAAAAFFLLRRRDLLPRLRAPALAAPLIPVGIALAGLTQTRSEIIYFGSALLLVAVIVSAASRVRRPEIAIAMVMLAGAAVLVADTLTGAWLTRTSAFTFPVLTSPRFYGLGNEYMGYLLGMSAVGLAAIWQLIPGRPVLFIAPAMAVALVVGAPFWGANWGGAFAVTVGLLAVWLLAVPHPWRRALPIALGLLMASIVVPAFLDLIASGTLARGTHIGMTAAAVLSGSSGAVGDIISRKVRMSLWILCYTPWPLALAAGTGAVLWLLLRAGAAARVALHARPQLSAGLAGALVGGVVAMVVNDSGALAGAGAICAVLATSIVLAASAAETAQ